MDKISKLLQVRKEKINELRESGVSLYPNDFKPSCCVSEVKKVVGKEPDTLGEVGRQFSLAGRMMAVNKMGKSSFVRFKDGSDQMQAYIQKDKVGDEIYAMFKKLDIGDFIGVSGPLFQTRTGEWTLLADQW